MAKTLAWVEGLKEIEELKADLAKFARHTADCQMTILRKHKGTIECTCDYDKAEKGWK